jgi:hypothetical protein
MSRPPARDIAKIFREGTLIDKALERAAHEAMLAHKRAGVPLVVWKDGKVVHVSPDEFARLPRRTGSRTKRSRKP